MLSQVRSSTPERSASVGAVTTARTTARTVEAQTWHRKVLTSCPTSRRRDERGSVTLFVVVIGVALFLVVGLVVDGGGKVRALQQAESVADQAARAGGQAIQTPSAVRGDGSSIDTSGAAAAARSYLSQAGVSGKVQILDGTRLRVTTATNYQTVFLGLIGITEMATEGEAEVRLVEGIDGGSTS